VELLIVVGLLVGLVVASLAWGADSRPGLRSKEWEQAALGLDWHERGLGPGPHVRPEEARPAIATALRVRRLARRLEAGAEETERVRAA
jgi:hypothetical protein